MNGDTAMPPIEITVAAGKAPEQIRELIHQVHDAAKRVTGFPDTAIKILVREASHDHWSEGDETIAERRVREISALPST